MDRAMQQAHLAQGDGDDGGKPPLTITELSSGLFFWQDCIATFARNSAGTVVMWVRNPPITHQILFREPASVSSN